MGAITNFAESVEEYGAAEGILLLTLVEDDVATTTQHGKSTHLRVADCILAKLSA
jgi:hypothetical protein